MTFIPGPKSPKNHLQLAAPVCVHKKSGTELLTFTSGLVFGLAVLVRQLFADGLTNPVGRKLSPLFAAPPRTVTGWAHAAPRILVV